MNDLHLPDHILIVGAGVIGLSVAWQLARRDHRVFVIDRDRPGQGATAVSGGMLGLTAEAQFGEQDLLALQKESLAMFPNYVTNLHRDSGVDPCHCTYPTMIVARDRDDVEALQRIVDYQKKVGLNARWLDADTVQKKAPYLRNILRGVACEDDHLVDPNRLTEALVGGCEHHGVEIVEDQTVRRVLSDKGRATGVQLADGSQIFADDIVICAGTWSGNIEGIPEFDRSVLRPVRGQTVTIGAGSHPLLDGVVRSPDVYLVPRHNGRLVIGSTMEEKGFDDDVTAGAVRTLLDEAWQILPAIDERPIDSLKSGFRPVSLDDRPLVGPSTLDHLFLATGHGRHGILLAAVTGRMMARYVEHPEMAGQNYRSFDPRRFAS